MPALLNFLSERPGPHAEHLAQAALHDMGHAALPGLRATLKGEEREVRLLACEVLQTLQPPPEAALPELRDLLRQGNSLERAAAARTLLHLGQPALPALPDLINALEAAQTPTEVSALCEALGRLAALPRLPFRRSSSGYAKPARAAMQPGRRW
ncbi:MAG: HEAT repeat domain-containing protein [Anaerolineae bacterium]|nr:HEAT repeat domain-containing protein [Anaerolineae bacterium]